MFVPVSDTCVFYFDFVVRLAGGAINVWHFMRWPFHRQSWRTVFDMKVTTAYSGRS